MSCVLHVIKTGMIFDVFICQDMESYLSEHTSENRATIEELKQEMIVNSILSDMVKTDSDEYVQRLETLEKQVLAETVICHVRFTKFPF